MIELAGYYDGTSIKFLEEATIRENQRVRIIVTDEFLTTPTNQGIEGLEKSRRAYDRLLAHAKPGVGSGDYKKDLLEMLEKKYENVG